MEDDSKLALLTLALPIAAVALLVTFLIINTDELVFIVLYCLAAAFAIAGIAMLRGAGAWLVAGYNTMTPEEKASVDPLRATRGCGVAMIGAAVMIALVCHGFTMMLMGLLVLTGCVIFAALYSNKK